jgi:hypothetical protein
VEDKKGAWLSKPAWQGIGALVGSVGVVVATIFGVLSLRQNSQPKESSLVNTPYPDLCKRNWFFSPAPSGCLYNFRSTPATTQVFDGGHVIWLQDRGEVFVFLRTGEWSNHGGTIDTVVNKYPEIQRSLGSASSERKTFISCVGNSNYEGTVTAYVTTDSQQVLTWTIVASDHKHTGWSFLDKVDTVFCS